MEYGYLGRSNLEVSRVCLGTMHYSEATSQEDAFRIMDKALDMGINFFDTANVYGNPKGATEEIIGNWFALGGGRREKVILATKVSSRIVPERGVPNEKDGISAYKVKRHLEDSLRRLKTDHIDLYTVHHIDKRISVEEFWDTFDRVVDDGKATYIGTSNFTGWGLAKYQMAAQHRGHLGIVSEQLMYNLLCRYAELEVIPACKEFGIGVLPYMPLAGGMLSGKKTVESGSRTASVYEEYNLPLELDQLNRYNKLCADLGEKGNVVAAAWVLRNPAVSSVLIGARTEKHLDDIPHIAELKLPDDFVAELEKIFDINSGRKLRPGLTAPNAYAW